MAYFEVVLGTFCGLGFFFTYLLYATGGNINGYVVFLLFILSVIFIADAFRRWNKKRVNAFSTARTYPQFQNNTPHTNSTPSLSEIQKTDIRRTYTFEAVKRDFEILKDSFEISQTTSNTEIFCMRYKLCMEKALSLRIAYNSGVKMFDGMPKVIETVLGAKDALRFKFLTNGISAQISDAEILKTDDGKLNRYVKIVEHLERNKSVFEGMGEFTSVCDKLKQRILELSMDKAVSESKAIADTFSTPESALKNFTITVESDIPDVLDLDKFNESYQARSEVLAAERTSEIAAFDPYSVELSKEVDPGLNSIEKGFLKKISGQPVVNPFVAGYWYYEYNLRYQDVITKLLSFGYLGISNEFESAKYMKIPELQAILRKAGLPVSGRKSDLLDRIFTNIPVDELKQIFNETPKKYILTEKGKFILLDYPKSATYDFDFEDKCIEAILNGDMDGAYQLIGEYEKRKPFYDGRIYRLSDENIKFYTDMLVSDTETSIPDHLKNTALIFKACNILGNMMGWANDKTTDLYLRKIGETV